MNRLGAALIAVALASLFLFTIDDLRGPDPLPPDAPDDRFSAARAGATLRDLLDGVTSHPTGTATNRVVRDRVVAKFRELGLETALQRGFVCNATPVCATVENIVATSPGDPGPYVLLVSHYDSVGAGPGASDAGVPVAAILETARALRGTRGVAFLITDGEEAGLLGAELFVTTPMKDRVSVVVNAENRGTSGPAFLFETSRGNAALVPAIRDVDRPYASSLFYTIYEMLPNDTDVSVFKRAGLQAVNFAAIGGVENYHTPLDDLRHVDAGTLQHHGDNLLSITRALLRGVTRTESNAVFFNVLRYGVVSWPQLWTIVIAVVSLIGLIAGARNVPRRDVFTGSALTVLSLIVAAILAFAMVLLAHSRAGDATRLAQSWPAEAAMWCSGLAGALSAFSITSRRDARALHTGAAVVWHLAAIGLAIALPGTAYLLLVPAVGMTVAIALRLPPLIAACVASLIAGVMLFSLALFLYPALGKTSLIPIALIVAALSTTFVPLFDRRALMDGAVITTLGAIVAAGLTTTQPVYTPDHPRRQALEHELDPPTVTATVERNGEVATIRVRSSREANRLMLSFDKEVVVNRVNGVTPAAPSRGRVARGQVTVYGREAVVEVNVSRGTAVEASDLTYGLPPEDRGRIAARDGANAVTTGRGDVTVSRKQLVL